MAPNRLSTAASAYLRSAADQPVAWYPWSREPFERARAEGKPILLDIGAVWCHWCHVMDHESYEDAEVADLLNSEWICIKVDRDERPDVDARFQRAVQAFTGQGGWPLTAFLTPEGEVFFGGTYFPPDARHGRPGFRTILEELARRYREQPEEIEKNARELTEHLRAARPDLQQGALDPALLDQTADAMARTFDFRNGGFGTQPKFPHASALEFLLTYFTDTGEQWAGEIVMRTLAGMAYGGIRDHVGGGFHRYAVDARWIVPHFEKMLYDNASLLSIYARALNVTSLPGYDRQLLTAVVTESVQWVHEVMADPAGGYYGSQDADVNPGDDGDYFTWTPDEVAAAIDDDDLRDLVVRHYDVYDVGEMHHNPRKNVLWIRKTTAQLAEETARDESEIRSMLAQARDALRAHRQRRPAPFVDTTLFTGWNAMMVSAMVDAAASLERPDLEDHAIRTIERFFVDAAEPDLASGMRHAIGSDVTGILDDQVLGAHAALDAFEVTGEQRWLERAQRLMSHVMAEYVATTGGLRDALPSTEEGAILAQELVPVQDAPIPSGNGMAVIVLSRLATLTDNPEWRESRDGVLEALAGSIPTLATFGATLARGLDWAVRPSTSIVIVGEPDETRDLRWTARRSRPPRTVMQSIRGDQSRNGLPDAVQGMMDGSAPAAYVCQGTQCAPPAHSADQLLSTLEHLEP